MRSALRVAGVCIAIVLSASSAVACPKHALERVVLYGTGGDSDVLLWDSRFRLREYHLATFDEAQAMLPRALLVRGGARALVLHCLRDYVQARYALGLDDAVDVRIVSGPQRGTTGWISGADVRYMR